MNIGVNAFFNSETSVKVERMESYRCISIRKEGSYVNGVNIFFDTENSLQNFIAVISANKEDASVD